MNFGEDPLADLLSDNSLDNNGFFENPTWKRTTQLTNKSATKLNDLLGIKEESQLTQTLPVPKARLPASSATTNYATTPRPANQNPIQSKLLPEDDDDDLGFDPQKPKAASKLNLLDDLFASTSVSETRRPTTAVPVTGRRDTDRPGISRQSTDTTTETSNVPITQQRPKTSAGRRSSSTSNAMTADPLGLFGGQVKEKEKDMSTSGMSTPSTRKRGTTADWLGLRAEPEEPSKKEALAESPQRTVKQLTATSHTTSISTGRENFDILKILDNVAEDVLDAHELELQENAPQQMSGVPPGDSTAQNIFLLNTHQMEMKNAYTALQQQESQLTLAAQMKKQERVLVDMQRKQEALLQQQERQFQALIQQQLHRQQQMENHIKMQQQRINTHIHLLMSQPALLAPMSLPPAMQASDDLGERMGSPDGTPDKSEEAKAVLRDKSRNHSGSRSRSHSHSRPTSPQNLMLETVKLEADMKRLELEKLRLEELVANQKVNYESEIELIERSYKKQLEVVEHHAQSIETRLKAELEELTKHYTQKLESLESEKQKLKSDCETDFSTLKQDHEDEMRRLKKSHDDDLEMLKEEHRRMLESVRQSKLLEFAALQENGSYMEILKAASSNLENLSGDLQSLRDDMQSRLESLHKEREKKLEARERRLEDAEKRLKMNEESAEEEKKRLMMLVSNLEQQLNKLSKDSAEENWQLRQRMASIEAEKAAFEKEKEFARENIARDEKRLADLKEQQLAESQRAAVELQEERARIYFERTKIETESQLHSDHDVEKQRLEMEAIMKVAQDAARQADVERERYHKSLRQLEQQKRELIDKENTLRAKEDELQQETLAFRMAEHKSQEAQQRARTAEQNFQMKIQNLQQRMRELGEREVNLSQERMMLTQERISMEQLKTRLMEKRCALCKMGEQREKVVQFLSGHDGEQVGAVEGARAEGNNLISDSTMNHRLSGVLTEQPRNSSAEEHKMRHMLEEGNIVDRMLDENIAESYRKMRATTSMEYWPEMVLDDDAKEQALNYLDNGILCGNVDDMFNRNLSNKYQ
ncbi:golgin subfamily A member 6-like protein 26 [Eurosta solidaginis]|uniref:golgin subfamily A member 6-like protein 26 n=1 Tax=Eurosta solidaginis TaxID=178769 RepID=UPI0035313050